MPIYALEDKEPQFEDRSSNWIAPDAVIVGNVHIARNANIWFGAVLRGDNEMISIGEDSNVQEHVVMHTDPGFALTIGKNCTIGHKAMLHGCTIGDNSLVGMSATILNGANIAPYSLVGAGALVTEGKEFPERSMILGSPAKRARGLSEAQLARLEQGGSHYVRNGRRFMTGLREIG